MYNIQIYHSLKKEIKYRKMSFFVEFLDIFTNYLHYFINKTPLP